MAHSSLRSFAKKELCHLKIVFFVSIDQLYFYICNVSLFCIVTDNETDFNEVYLATVQLSANWKDIGSRLGITRPTIDIIAQNNSNNVTGCMSDMIASWLKRESQGQCLPTWRNMCTAIAGVDLTTAESIAASKGFHMPTGRLYNHVNIYANYICFLN